MKKFLFLVAAVFAAFTAGSAFAADLPSRKAPPPYLPPPPPPPLWTGLYAGLNIGGAWSANSGRDTWLPYTDVTVPGSLFILPGGGNTSSAGGVVGGGQIGYNYQFGNSIVLGFETDFQGTSLGSGHSNNNWAYSYPSPLTGFPLTPLATGNNAGLALNWFGTVRGRAGFLFTPTLLLYGTGGFAYGQVGGNVTGWNNTRTGWTAGGGVEWLFLPNWSAKAEYLFVDLTSNGSTGASGWDWGYHRHPQVNVVRAGVNYHFNWGAPAPVVARY